MFAFERKKRIENPVAMKNEVRPDGKNSTARLAGGLLNCGIAELIYLTGESEIRFYFMLLT